MSDLVTPVQQAALEFMRLYIAAHKRPPSYDEIKTALGLKSKGNVSRIMNALEKRNIVRRHKGMYRSLEIVDPDKGEAITLNPRIAGILKRYAEAEHMTAEAAANLLISNALEAA